MSFTINNNLSFIASFKSLSSSLNSLVKNLGKDGFKYLIQEFHNGVLDLVKQKRFYPYEYMSDFEKFKEEIPWPTKKISEKEYGHVPNDWNKFEMKTMKDYYNLYLKCDILLLADLFEKFRNDSLWVVSKSLII